VVAVQIRAAGRDDLELLPETLGPDHHDYFRAQYHLVDEGLAEILFAFEDGRLVGGVLATWVAAHEWQIVKHLDGVPMIAHLHVVRTRRGRGYGRLLIETAEQVLRQRGHDSVLIGVNKSNHSARALYLHLGYDRADHPDLHGIDPEDGTDTFDVYVARLDRRLPPPSAGLEW
jgi:GNAT superfamily N-acetyltransferase